MKIRVSKVFADYLNKLAKEGVLTIREAAVVEFSEQEYDLNVGDVMDADYYGDYNPNSGMYKAILVIYPYEFYAMPKYLSTELLTTVFNWKKVSNEQELREMLKDLINI